LSLADRVAVVTGAGRGLGRAHALALTARGARVVVNDIGGALDGSALDSDPGSDVVAEITAAGGAAIADRSSVATPAGGAAVVEAAIEAFGRIDIVVNNAGILRDAAFHKLTDEQLSSVLDVHLRGTVHVTRAAWHHFREQGHGRVVTTTSNAGLLGNFGQANYAAAKMGLVGLTKVLAIEGANRGIKVNAIAPIARTRMTEHVLGDLAEAGDPAFAAALVVLLASDDCPTSGEVWSVGGGRIARYFVGLTRGWSCRSEAPEPEEILAHLDEIEDRESFRVLPDAMAELDLLRQLQPTARTPVHASVPQEAT
jgi:NAD(P)-dependent dehydrogenase (short-subunit alcohol dehydrogenase family)